MMGVKIPLFAVACHTIIIMITTLQEMILSMKPFLHNAFPARISLLNTARRVPVNHATFYNNRSRRANSGKNPRKIT
jgi:hypothetical protein